MRYLIVFSLFLTGCATTMVDQRRSDVLNCIKDFRSSDVPALEGFEICRQVYGLKKLKE